MQLAGRLDRTYALDNERRTLFSTGARGRKGIRFSMQLAKQDRSIYAESFRGSQVGMGR
jgi:hypothetical protein